MGCFVVGNFLCMRELLNVLAANGEQGELGSDWCSGSWVLLCFKGWRSQVCRPRFGWFCGRGWGCLSFGEVLMLFFEGGEWCLEEGLF